MDKINKKAKRMDRAVNELPPSPTGDKQQNLVVSLSGGKDSTAMLHMMLERGEKIHSAVFFDTGWEFPEMHTHLDMVEQKTGVKVIRLEHPQGFNYWLTEREIKTKTDRRDEHGIIICKKGDVFRIGNGWPSPSRRWCTREKVDCIKKHLKTIPNHVSCIGIAADEMHRVKPGTQRYPLIEYGTTEATAIEYCRSLGYTWGGLYDIFNRVSCWCCPLQSLQDLRLLRLHRPELWSRMLEIDKVNPSSNRGFRGYKTVADLDERFAKEDQLRPLFNGKTPPLRIIKRLERDGQVTTPGLLAPVSFQKEITTGKTPA